MEMRGQYHAPAALTPGKRARIHCTVDRVRKASPAQAFEPDRPAREKSLYRLRYPRRHTATQLKKNVCRTCDRNECVLFELDFPMLSLVKMCSIVRFGLIFRRVLL